MKKIPTIQGESLEDAYKRLEEAGRYVQTYMVFEKHNIYSNHSLDDAYKEVYGVTRDQYLARQSKAEIAPDEEENVESAFNFEPRDVIKDLRISILINAVDSDTGEYHSEVAKHYIKKMSRYTKYCKEDKKSEWINSISGFVYCVGKKEPDGEKEVYSDEQIEAYLEFYEKLGYLMELLATNTPWNEIISLVKSYNLSSDDTESLQEQIIKYSPWGEEFNNVVFGVTPETLKKVPKKEKEKD